MKFATCAAISLSLCIWLCLPACRSPEPVTLEQQVHAVFRELRSVRMMRSGKTYEVAVNGKVESGTKEWYLRRRNANEIWQSRLSSGCGDYSLAFAHRLQEYGVEILMIDAAELSQHSLESRFAGHSVIAARQAGTPDPWWLIDPSSRRILSREWDPQSTAFEANGKRFWIGFCGSVADYPVIGPEALRDFYDRTLNELPESELQRLHLQSR